MSHLTPPSNTASTAASNTASNPAPGAPTDSPPPSWHSPLPRGVWVLGLVSMLTDISTEMVSGLLPVYLITVLGASASQVGWIEGVAGATTMVVKIFSGSLSDYLRRRKPLVLAGYSLSALAKPLLALASGLGFIVAARVLDRVGKGVRDAPRDALIADITHPAQRGAAYGLRQALDTVGAFVGPLAALGLMVLWANDFQAIFWVATVPAGLAVLLIALGIRETGRPHANANAASSKPLSRHNLRQLDPAFWWLVAMGAAFTLARFSEAFLVLRAQQSGLALAWTPLVLIVMNVVYATLAYPFGRWSDRIDPQRLLSGGLLVLAAADGLLALGGTALWAGVALWGLHMAMTQGLLASLLAGAAPAHLRGTAYGIFYLVSGAALLVASTLAGALWDAWGAPATFLTGAFFCALALGLLWVKPVRRSALT